MFERVAIAHMQLQRGRRACIGAMQGFAIGTACGLHRHVADGAVVHRERLVGLVGLTVDAGNRNGWFWYWMHAGFRGRGWTSRAAATVADWALTDGGLQRLELGHRIDNPASGAVARAAGFVQEGFERSKLLIDGERLDVVAYSRLPTDPWPTVPRLAITNPV